MKEAGCLKVFLLSTYFLMVSVFSVDFIVRPLNP